MNEEQNNPNSVQPSQESTAPVPPIRPSGEKVIQPSANIQQELAAQQQTQAQVPQPIVASPQVPPAAPTTNPTNVYPEPTSGQMQVGMSASQLGLHEPKSKLFDFNPKQLIIRGIVALVVLGAVFTALVMTNIIALSEFRSVGYTNSKGTSYKFDFYSKHGTKQLSSGNKQLVSKVSKDGKFPIAISISTGDSSELNKNGIKTCSGPLPKVFDVQNDNLNQTISVCNFPQKNGEPVGVYVAGFEYNNQAHIVTIGQDISGANLSSQGAAQETLTKFGIEQYNDDIKKIVSSLKVE